MKEYIEHTEDVIAAGISIGPELDGVQLDIAVVPVEYDVCDDEHHIRYDEVENEGPEYVKTGNWIRIISSADPTTDKRVSVSHNGWYVFGIWTDRKQLSDAITEYRCHNSLFEFTLTINKSAFK